MAPDKPTKERADYSAYSREVTKVEAEELVADARKFVEKMRGLIK